MDEKKLTLIQNANMASIANAHLSKIIEAQKAAVFSKLKARCRNSQHDVVEYASLISAINALDDIQGELRKQINAAQQIEKEMMKYE